MTEGTWLGARHRRILDWIDREGHIEADLLAREFQVSRETVRRDLLHLEQSGFLRRVHGGAVLLAGVEEAPFGARRSVDAAEKRRIAGAALQLVQPGQCCFLDTGTTTSLFAAELARVPNITIVTNSLDAIGMLRDSGVDSDLVMLGGVPSRDAPGTFGELVIEQIARFRADVAFLSPVGIHPDEGVTYFHLREAEVARQMARHARHVVLLANKAKLGVVSRVHLFGCDRIDVLVSDAGASDTASFKRAGIGRIVTA